MSPPKQGPASRFLIAFIIGALLSTHAWAQHRAIRRALVNSILNRSSTSPLLTRMFSPGGAAFRGGQQNSCNNYNTFNGYGVLSDGTPYDPFLAGSFADRYLAPGSTISRFPNYGAPQANYGYISANAANMAAPASGAWYPGTLNPPYLEPSAGVNGLTGGMSPAFLAPRPVPLSPVGFLQSPPNTLAEGLWQAQKQQQISSTPPVDYDAPTSLPPPQASRVNRSIPTETVERSLRQGAFAFRRGNFDKSRQAYRRAVQLGCDDSRGRLGLALADFAVGQFDDAAHAVGLELSQASHIDRSKLDLRLPFADPRLFTTALKRLESTAAANPENARLWLLLGYLKFYSGSRADGAVAWQRYLASPAADPLIASEVRKLTGQS